jgi:hypothetical protein
MSDRGSEPGPRGGIPRRAGALRKLGGQIPPDLVEGGLRDHQTEKAKFPENQDRVACARAGQQTGDQDVRVDTDE